MADCSPFRSIRKFWCPACRAKTYHVASGEWSKWMCGTCHQVNTVDPKESG